MDIKELNKELKEKAIELNACYKGVSPMDKELSEDELITLWKMHIDFAIDKDFPGVPFINSNFDKDTLHKNLIWVDEEVSHYKKNGTIIVNGGCTGTITCSSFNANRIYVRHESEITINCDGMSKVFIDVHNKAKVHINQSQASVVYVYLHDDAVETHTGEIRLRRK